MMEDRADYRERRGCAMRTHPLLVIVIAGAICATATGQAPKGSASPDSQDFTVVPVRSVFAWEEATPHAGSSEANGGSVMPDCSPRTPQHNVWGEVDLLLWWLKPVCLKPPTLTSGSPFDAAPGAIGQPNTHVLIEGEHKFEFKGANGIRPILGFGFNEDRSLGLLLEGFVLERVAANQVFVTGNGSPTTYLPYQDPANVQRSLPFTIADRINGSSLASGSTQLWGTEADAYYSFSTIRGSFLLSAQALAGFRYLNLRDQVLVTNELGPVGDPTSRAVGQDKFTTQNQFYGPQVGARLSASCGDWTFEGTGKLAAGLTRQEIEIAGSPLLAAAGNVNGLVPGPLLALPSNIGRQSSDRVTLVPEISFNIRYRITDQWAVSVGYGLLYWNKVLCPGDQMDSHVSITQLPGHGPLAGPAVPAPMFVHTDAFAQGLNAGIEFKY